MTDYLPIYHKLFYTVLVVLDVVEFLGKERKKNGRYRIELSWFEQGPRRDNNNLVSSSLSHFDLFILIFFNSLLFI